MPSSRSIVRRRLAPILAAFAALGAAACAGGSRPPSAAERRAIADTLTRRLEAAYDFSADTGGRRAHVVERLMSLYPDSGRVVSAAAGRVVASRDTLQAEVRHFWEWIGTNMREPRTRWGPRFVDVLSPTAAVVTTSFAIDHLTPQGQPHTIATAWTALFEKRGGRWVIVQEHLSDRPMQAQMAGMPMGGTADSGQRRNGNIQ